MEPVSPNESSRDRAKPRGRLYRAFVNPEERRLRAGGRIFCFSVLYLALMAVEITLALILSGGELLITSFSLSFIVANLAVTLLAVWLARRFLDRRPFLDLGLRPERGWWADLFFGAALGGVLMAGIYLVEWAAGWLAFSGFAWDAMDWGQLLLPFAVAFFLYVVVGINEELMMRGYVMQNLAAGLNMFWAVFISSAVFGLMHLGNPHASWLSSLNIAVVGVLLAAGYLVTRSLWLPIGLHFGWNFFQGTVFGFPVSGVGADAFHLIRQTVAGPEWVTGGSFGPEAGLTGLAAEIVGIALIWLWGRARERFDV